MPRARRTEEEMPGNVRPVVLRLAGGHYYNDRGEDVSTRLPSSFPVDWSGDDFDYRNGWTRLRKFFVDDYLGLLEMQEIIESRFKKLVQI